jgi:hypothetical protein
MEAKISILTLPQRIEGNRLFFNVLTIPRNINPLEAHPDLAPYPAWADATLTLQANLFPSLEEYPRLDLQPTALSANLPIAPYGVEARDIFGTLAQRFDISNGKVAEAPEAHHFARKYLPESYRKSFNFTKPRSKHAAIDDSYACAITKEEKPDPAFVPDDDTVSWGQVFGFCLRQPAIAKKCGFIHEELFMDIAPGALENGGWLYVDFAPGSDFDFLDKTVVKRYAARLPKISAGTERSLFAAVLFPVRHNAVDLLPDNPELPSAYDDLLLEASIYDDGFAKIVHAHQPVSDHLLKEKRDADFPVTNDAGIRLAWDDEQLLTWMNRQLEADPAHPGEARRVDAPLGVFGYHIDAREKNGDPNNPNAWTSLCRVQNKAELVLGATSVGAIGDGGELNVEVYPTIPDGDKMKHFWLPAFFAYWTGKSLVLQDEDAIDLFRKELNEQQKGVKDLKATKNTMYDAVGLENIPLHYGGNYEFRVRLADITGGGPTSVEEAIYDAEAPIASWLFRRHAIPQTVRIQNELPERDDTYFSDNELTVQRPRLGYPSVLFAGTTDVNGVFSPAYPNALDLLKADFDAALGKRDIGIADPDVDRLEIEVAVRALDMDTTIAKHHAQDNYAILYTTKRAFPADFDGSLSIPLTFLDRPVIHFNGQKNLSLLGLSDNNDMIDDLPDLVLPTNRDIQITVRAVCTEKNDYYADNEPLRGMTTRFVTRRTATSENGFFKATGAQTMIRGIFLRRPEQKKISANWKHVFVGGKAAPDQQPELIEQLAKAIDVEAKGMSLMGKTGQRWQFGAARAIRHTLSPDNTSLTIATQDDMVNHWLVPITLLIDRDWSWDGVMPVSVDIFRRKKFSLDADWGEETLIGDIEIKKAINIQALVNSDRSQTFVCFIDAVEPKSADPALHPDEIMVEYRVQPNFKMDNPAMGFELPLTLALNLPITTPPAQMPKIVSAGMALSRYVRDADYANTEARQRYLWVEFEEPVRNPRDAYFARITAYAPDPLLAEWTPDWMVPRQPPALAIEPEPVRIISPGHTDNRSGLNAMQQLLPATESKRHFLVPLPPGLHPESSELFGFFTYEFRIGHAEGWSTAQGRFGRAFESQGVQHPAPQLYCSPDRNEQRLRVSASHSVAVFDGRNVTSRPVRTQLWALLYAQVRMADNSDNRNVLLNDRLMRPAPERIFDDAGNVIFSSENSDAPKRAIAEWDNAEVSAMLKNHGLPGDSNLSVLCVEMMPTADHFLMNNHEHGNFGVLQNIRGADSLPSTASGQALNFMRGVAFNLRETAAQAGPNPEELTGRPLSDDLGHFRILRTSTLASVPEVCCVDC